MTNIKYTYAEEYPPIPVQGSITINFDLFPQELLKQMIEYPYSMPHLNLRLPVLILTDGLVLESGSEGSKVSFDFVADDVEVCAS